MKLQLLKIRQQLEQFKGERNLLIRQRDESLRLELYHQQQYEDTLKARSIVQKVAEDTQKQIEYQISNLATMALAAVFPEPYEVQLRFVKRRNKTEADLIFIKNGNEIDDILENGGGGVADVASLALRFALWSIKKSAPIMILDEPTKYLHNPMYQERASELIKTVAQKLVIQIILVSDQPELLSAADKIITLENVKGVTYAREN